MTVESVNPHLGESTVLTVVLCPYARLEVQSLSQTGALRNVKQLGVYHIHQVRRKPSLRLTSVGRHHYLVEGHVVGFQLEVQFLRVVLSYSNFLLLSLVSKIRHLNSERAFRQVLQEIVSRVVRCSAYSGTLQPNCNVWHVFATLLILYVSVNIGIGSLNHGVSEVLILCHLCCPCRLWGK